VVTFGRGIELIELFGEIDILDSVAIIANPKRRVEVVQTAFSQVLFNIAESDITVSFASLDLKGEARPAQALIRIGDVANVKLTVKDMSFDNALNGIDDIPEATTGSTINVLNSRFLSGIKIQAVVVSGIEETVFVKGCFFGAVSSSLGILVRSNGQSITITRSLFDGSEIVMSAGAAPSTVLIDRVTVRGTRDPLVFATDANDYTVRVTRSLLESLESGNAILFATATANNLLELFKTCYDGVSFASGVEAANTVRTFASVDTSMGSSKRCLKAEPSFFYKAKLEKIAAEQSEQGRTAAAEKGSSATSFG